MSEDSRYEAVRSRDARFDGAFFFAVSTTGIYCRPSCPATTPRRRNVTFFPTAAAAQGSGFRACRRCRPDAVPGSAEWNARADVVGRAMRLIGDGVVDREGVAGLADRLGYSARQVQRQLTAELGAGPAALARAQRAHTARVLLQTTGLPIAEIAFAAGFASVRQFNDTIKEIYALTPSALRDARPSPGLPRALNPSPHLNSVRSGGPPCAREAPVSSTSPPGGGTSSGGPAVPSGTPGVLPLRLAYRGPYAARQIFDYLARRALDGTEEVIGEPGRRTYRRTLRLPVGTGIAEVDEATGDGWLDCRLHLTELRDLATAAQRVRRLFDLDADPYAVGERLGADPALAPLVARRPGLRSPGTVDPEELAVRAVLGRSGTAAGRAHGARLVAAHGEPLPRPSGTLTHLFPPAAELADAPLTGLGLAPSRTAVLRALATALTARDVVLDAGMDRDRAGRALRALPGIGPWTAGYLRMRALGDPDVLLGAPPPDADPAVWSPWRSYATHYLWAAAHAVPTGAPERHRNPTERTDA
ncbi:helix-turn-helix domain-containing protein (plasmid) [Streptomyces sp. BHT-5-2]|uniref:DNA-3-methyladenine glycosylase 2 family protein n=1 Tax=Streptomyces sp. BHT-5-2 TaxID=2866715 RepID=UPI001C8E73FD|nr:DNA-3-methyladenine glycosylase 2 family protein [Streptomyces sp. BHT-5-2]QZL07539.1 helix-turn-helix domain-containing protein [Streptomyces sp. BHT-5-2]